MAAVSVQAKFVLCSGVSQEEPLACCWAHPLSPGRAFICLQVRNCVILVINQDSCAYR
jgi:hypothetical protein